MLSLVAGLLLPRLCDGEIAAQPELPRGPGASDFFECEGLGGRAAELFDHLGLDTVELDEREIEVEARIYQQCFQQLVVLSLPYLRRLFCFLLKGFRLFSFSLRRGARDRPLPSLFLLSS